MPSPILILLLASKRDRCYIICYWHDGHTEIEREEKKVQVQLKQLAKKYVSGFCFTFLENQFVPYIVKKEQKLQQH